MKFKPLIRVSSMGWVAWLATLASAACLCGVLAYWVMQLGAPVSPVAPVASGAPARERPDLSSASGLFGLPRVQQAAAAPVLGNVQVLGVVSAGRLGSAILIVDGKPARAYAVGDSLGPGQRVQSVRRDRVIIDDNGRQAEVAAPAATSTAVLTSGAGRPRGSTDPTIAPPAATPGGMPAPASGMPAGPSGMPAPAGPGVMPGVGTMPSPSPPPGSMPAPASPQYLQTPGPMPGQNMPQATPLAKPGTPTS